MSQPMDPALRIATALPARYYVGDAMQRAEQTAVFAKSWQLVAHAGQLAAPGDHIVEHIGAVPILVLRDEDGVLRAFPNVCKHRAGPLAHCNGHGARALHCKYHGWTYRLDGTLRSAPEMQDAEDFHVEDIRLTAFRVVEWQGLIFVAIDPKTPAFDALYGDIVARIAPLDISAMRFTRRDSYDIDCNWKVYIDNYLEGYHLPHVHPGLSKVLDYRIYDTTLSPWKSLQHSPLRNSADIYGEGDAFYYFVYPNVMLNIMPGRLQTNRILPLGPERCRVEFDYYYAQDEAALARIARDQEFSDEVQQEDIDICVAVQKGLASGHYDAGRLCPKRESGLWHFHTQLREAYAAAQL